MRRDWKHHYRFDEEFGSIYLYDDRGNLVYMVDEVAFAYDGQTHTVHKHGSEDNIYKWLANVPNNIKEILDLKVLITPSPHIVKESGLDLDEYLDDLTMVIASTGFIKRYIEKYCAALGEH